LSIESARCAFDIIGAETMNSSANTTPVAPEGFNLFIYRVKKKFTGPDPYLTVAVVFLWLFTYWVL